MKKQFKPFLRHIRELMHADCLDLTEEIKWGMSNFVYCGEVMASMSAFKEHVSFGFWKQLIIPRMDKYVKEQEAKGIWGRISSVEGIPPDKDVIEFVKIAAKLNEEGIDVKSRAPKPVVVNMPEDFMKAIRANKKALETYENFSPSNKGDYADWINEAKWDKTRQTRMGTAIEWMSEGKPSMWKYMKK